MFHYWNIQIFRPSFFVSHEYYIDTEMLGSNLGTISPTLLGLSFNY